MKKKILMIVCLILTTGVLLVSCGNTSTSSAVNQQPKSTKTKETQTKQEENRKYSIEQAVSDKAQLNTIAFNGLAFLTGTLGADSFMPPGKVADYFGFQYMRDIDANGLGHNTTFLTRIANNVFYILNDEQKEQLIELAKDQEQLYKDFAYKRFPLMKAFRRNLEDEIPEGTNGLDKEEVKEYTAELYELDGLLSYHRAEVVGGVIKSLTAEQKEYLNQLAFNNSSTWPERKEIIDKKSMSHMAHVAVMTYASELFSWYAGSLDADVYFCPERHGTYFGGFYMKDLPAMGNPDYFISTSLTGNSGEKFLEILNAEQRKLITDIIDLQREDIQEIVEIRRNISQELRRFMQEEKVDKDNIIVLVKRYGELDGEMSYYYADRFAQVNKTLTAEQRTKLMELRNLDVYPKGAYLYSEAIAMPDIMNTDFLFGENK